MAGKDQVGFLISVLARLKGETQASLSQKCGISRATINRYFRGRTELKARDFVALLTVLGVDLVSEISHEIEAAGSRKIHGRETVYKDVVCLLRRLETPVRKTFFEQVLWWASKQKRDPSERGVEESMRKISSYLIDLVN